VTKQDLFDLMESDPESFTFDDFARLPDSLKDAEVVERWIEHVHHNLPGLAAEDPYAQIKLDRPDLITDSVRMLAAGLSVATLVQIKPEETDAYNEIAVHAISNAGKALGLIKHEARTRELVELIIEKCPHRIDVRATETWIGALVTPEMTERLLKTNVLFALGLPEQDVSRDQWRMLLAENPHQYEDVVRKGRMQVLVDFLKDGGWPCAAGFDLDPAETIFEAMAKFTPTKPGEPGHALYKAKLHTFPVEEVVSTLSAPDFIPSLVKVFPEAVLRKNMKHSRALRAHLLENDLGM
jgi:hypothetical protein